MPTNAKIYILSKNPFQEEILDRARVVIRQLYDLNDDDIHRGGLLVEADRIDTQYFLQNSEYTFYSIVDLNIPIRYFGLHHGSGDFPKIVSYLFILTCIFVDSEIWYGDDHSDESLAKFDINLAREIMCRYLTLKSQIVIE